ncbi:MAG TPA: diguanylate cyclase [Usitatibacter sp.]|nr:diguanylate cyclase [Usitatibacter sp.]
MTAESLMAWTDRRWRIRTVLIGLVLASLLPGLVGAGFLLLREYRIGIANREKDNIAAARMLVQAVDAQLDKARVLAQLLATARVTREGDLGALHVRAQEILALAGVGRNVVLTERSGQQVLNTLREHGAPLPHHGNPDLVRRVFDTGEPVTSDVYLGGVLRSPVLSVDVPVRADGHIVYDLSVGLTPGDFDILVSRARFPPEWVVAIFDSSGTIVARSQAPERYVGKKGTAPFIERILATGEGVMETTTLEGIEVVSAYSRSRATGWSVGIGVPRHVLQADLMNALRTLGIIFAVLFAASVALAAAAATMIGHSMRSLVRPAMALGSGEGAAPPGTAIREAAEVGRAITEASGLLAARARALEEANTALLARETELREAQHIARLGTWRWSRTDGVVELSEEARKLFGHGHCEFRAMRGTVLPEEDWDRVEKAMLEALRTHRGFEMQLAVNAATGERMWADVTCRALLDSHGEVCALMGTVQDITERKRAQDALRETEARFREQLERQVAERTAQLTEANHALERAVRQDVLTGLDNRLSANERLRAEFVRFKRGGNGYAVLVMDIDRFKSINDLFGHDTGDEVLRRFAIRLRQSLRETDFAARFGGEEFIAILPETREAGAMQVAEKIRADIAATGFPGFGSVTVSIGVACSQPGDTAEGDLVRRADTALYCAKGEGRNAVRAAAAE